MKINGRNLCCIIRERDFPHLEPCCEEEEE
jgi:hypothetical protein